MDIEVFYTQRSATSHFLTFRGEVAPAGALFEKDYYTLPLSIAYSYTLDGISNLFASGKLRLLRGRVPVAQSLIA